MPHPTSSRDFDAIRAEHPEVQFYVYALVLGGVTLELITPDQQVYRFDGRTLAEALEAAFPVSRDPVCPNTGLQCIAGCDSKTCAGLHVPLNEWPEPEASVMTPDIFD